MGRKNYKHYDIIGKRFNLFLILEELGRYVNARGNSYRMVKCQCDCGNIIKIRLTSVTSGQSKSCGCLTKLQAIINPNRTTHGLCNHPLYGVWNSMKQRCYDKNCDAYPNYGKRGIKICEEWEYDFKCFYEWSISNGWESGLDIDRRENDGNYEPNNCRFVNRRVNTNNTRRNILVYLNGERISLRWACEKEKLPYHSMRYRIKKGYSFDEAVKLYKNVD